MFTILHISDLHRSSADPISNKELVSALIADADRQSRETPRISRPDAVIVSGDLVQGLPVGNPDYPAGLARQYEEALELLLAICSLFLDGDRSRLVIIPGNHDVDWNVAFRAMSPIDMTDKNIPRLLAQPQSNYRWSWKDRQLYEISDVGLYRQRFCYFEAIYERFYAGAPLTFPVQATRPWNLFSFAGGKVVIAAFNSCVANDCFAVHGYIPSDAISESHLSLLNCKYAPELRVAVWHHDVQGPPMRNDYMDVNTVKLMIDKGYRLGLHGHQHKSEAGPYSLVTSEKQVMAVTSAGSLCAPPSEIPPGFQRQYNIVELADFAHARLHVRQAHVQGVFSAGVLPGIGNPSFVDLEWSSVPPGAVVNVGRGGGVAVELLDDIEQLLRTAQFSEAVSRIDAAGAILGNSGRMLKTEALFRQEDWPALARHLSRPINSDELGKAVRALIEIKSFKEAEVMLEVAAKNSAFPAALVRDLRITVTTEKAVGK